MSTNPQTPKLIKKGDGSVWRDHVCSCGKIIYKKNLTNNAVEFLVSKGPGGYKKQVVVNESNPSIEIIICPHCEAEHRVVGIGENITLE